MSLKHLRNPVSGEVIYCSPLKAKALARYGWEYVDRKVWVEYQRAKVQAAMLKNMPAAKASLGRLQ